jgi:hypothetical protein
MSELREPPAERRVPYHLLSVLLSLVVPGLGIAVLYGRIDWGSVAQVWTQLDPILVALAVAVYWAQCP